MAIFLPTKQISYRWPSHVGSKRFSETLALKSVVGQSSRKTLDKTVEVWSLFKPRNDSLPFILLVVSYTRYLQRHKSKILCFFFFFLQLSFFLVGLILICLVDSHGPVSWTSQFFIKGVQFILFLSLEITLFFFPFSERTNERTNEILYWKLRSCKWHRAHYNKHNLTWHIQ